jgi:hypothetical protein
VLPNQCGSRVSNSAASPGSAINGHLVEEDVERVVAAAMATQSGG